MNEVTLTSQESQAHVASVDATGRQSEEDGKPCVTSVTKILFEVHFAKLHFSLLAKITHKFSFTPRKFQNTAERENRHRKRAAD